MPVATVCLIDMSKNYCGEQMEVDTELDY